MVPANIRAICKVCNANPLTFYESVPRWDGAQRALKDSQVHLDAFLVIDQWFNQFVPLELPGLDSGLYRL